MSKGKGVARAAGILMVMTIASRLLGFVRDQAMTAKFGNSFETDAYFAAFTVPDLLYNLLVGGALSAAFIPVFSGYLAREEQEEGDMVASTIINLSLILLAVGIVFGMVYTPLLVPLVAANFSGKTLALTVDLTRLMFPSVLVTGLNGLLMGILNAHKRFTSPALGGLVYNVAIILGGVFLSSRYGIAGFSIGVLVGVVANLLIQLPSVKKVGFKYQVVLKLNHPGVKRIGLLMIPALIGLSANQINLIVNQNFASGLAEGSITALRIANRLMFVPLGVFGFSIAMAVFPSLTSAAAVEKWTEYKQLFAKGLRSIFFILIPASVGLMALAVPVIRLLFEQGQFTEQATLLTADALFYYCLGLAAQGGVAVAVRGFYAVQDTKTPVLVSIATIGVNYGLNRLLLDMMGAGGLALAYSLTGMFNLVLLLVLLARRLNGIGLRSILQGTLLIVGVSLAMGFGVYELSHLSAQFINLSTKGGQLLQVGVAVVAGAAIYAGLTLLIGMDEAQEVKGRLQRLLRRLKPQVETDRG